MRTGQVFSTRMLRYDDQIYYCDQQRRGIHFEMDKTRGICIEKLFDKDSIGQISI